MSRDAFRNQSAFFVWPCKEFLHHSCEFGAKETREGENRVLLETAADNYVCQACEVLLQMTISLVLDKGNHNRWLTPPGLSDEETEAGTNWGNLPEVPTPPS